MKRMQVTDGGSIRRLAWVIACLAMGAGGVSAADGQAITAVPAHSPVDFIACPIYRDTNNGRKSGCWLATDLASGVRYDIAHGRTKPQIGHEVLVEGMPSDEPNACGGVVLAPVHTAVLGSLCPAVMLPPEGFPGRVFHVSKDQVMPPADVGRPLPAPPYASRDWVIEFDYGSDFLIYQYSEVILDSAARYIAASRPKRVLVMGYAATRNYRVSGRPLAEPPQLAQARAKMVGEALVRLGVNPALLRLQWQGDPAPVETGDGLSEPSKRRVTIHVEL